MKWRCRILSRCGSRVMEVSHVAVRTRARDMAMVAEETADNSGPAKRRKVGNESFRSPSSTFVQTESLDREINVNWELEEGPCASCDASASVRSGCVYVPASCCSGKGSMEELKVADLEVPNLQESVETETAAILNLDESESTSTSDFKTESGELDSTTKQSSITSDSLRTVSEKMPLQLQAEIDEFFAVAQENLNKRFKDKYNYDVIDDNPLKGRFEWVQLKTGEVTIDGDKP